MGKNMEEKLHLIILWKKNKENREKMKKNRRKTFNIKLGKLIKFVAVLTFDYFIKLRSVRLKIHYLKSMKKIIEIPTPTFLLSKIFKNFFFFTLGTFKTNFLSV